MLRKCVFALIGLFVTDILIPGPHNQSIAGSHCGGRYSAGFVGRRILFRSHASGGVGVQSHQPAETGSRVERFYDSTGRWTGDGVDSMSTARPGQPVTNWWTQPQRH